MLNRVPQVRQTATFNDVSLEMGGVGLDGAEKIVKFCVRARGGTFAGLLHNIVQILDTVHTSTRHTKVVAQQTQSVFSRITRCPLDPATRSLLFELVVCRSSDSSLSTPLAGEHWAMRSICSLLDRSVLAVTAARRTESLLVTMK